METLKNRIKNGAVMQKNLKNQRKTVKIVGGRTMTPWEAECLHRDNRLKLRLLHAAYGVMKGKLYSEIENHYPEKDHPLNQFTAQILKLVEQYEEKTVCAD